MSSLLAPWIENEFYKVGTPVQAPKTFKGYIWLAAQAECKKCGRGHTQALRIHQVKLPSFLLGDRAIIHKPMPSEEKIATSFMVKVCENSVGCWRTCRPWKHLKKCFCIGECACPRAEECSCPKGCGNVGIHPCRCGRMFADLGGKHAKACPIGLFRRDSSFSIEYMRSQMVGPRGRA